MWTLTIVENCNDNTLSSDALIPDRKNVYIQVLICSLIVLLSESNKTSRIISTRWEMSCKALQQWPFFKDSFVILSGNKIWSPITDWLSVYSKKFSCTSSKGTLFELTIFRCLCRSLSKLLFRSNREFFSATLVDSTFELVKRFTESQLKSDGTYSRPRFILEKRLDY